MPAELLWGYFEMFRQACPEMRQGNGSDSNGRGLFVQTNGKGGHVLSFC